MEFSRKFNVILIDLIKKLDGYLHAEKGPADQKRCWIIKGDKYRQTKEKIIDSYELMQDLRKRFLNDS